MKLKDGELKVFYKGFLDSALDEDLRKVLRKHGYSGWASGTNLIEGVRDLALDKKK